MSIHRVDVVAIKMEKHPNADSLSVVNANGFIVVVRTADWKDNDLGAYIEPDMLVPIDRQEFIFLGTIQGIKTVEQGGKKYYRIRVKKLRGVMSMGLLVPAPADSKIGDNIIDQLGIVRYEPPVPLNTGGEAISPPPGIRPCYDVESAYRYAHLFEVGEEIICTEKVHGSSSRYCYVPDIGMFCGSRTEWKREDEKNLWWRAMKSTPGLFEFCQSHPEITVYGEVYGQVQDLKYGYSKGEVAFVAFDLMRAGQWVDYEEARALCPLLNWVPTIYRGPWDKEKVFAMADGDSMVAEWGRNVKQIREGIVVKPIHERTCLEIGRVQLKIVSNSYLERA